MLGDKQTVVWSLGLLIVIRMFGPKRIKATGWWTILCSKELCDLYTTSWCWCSLIEYDKMDKACCMYGEMWSAFSIWQKASSDETTCQISHRRVHIKLIIEMDWECWLVGVAEVGLLWHSFVCGNVLTFILLNVDSFLTNWMTVITWGRILLHVLSMKFWSALCLGERFVLKRQRISLGVTAETYYLWDVFLNISIGFLHYSTSSDVV